MAKIININDTNQLNISASVGSNGINLKDDVIVVQALMKYALEGGPGWGGVQFPQPNGLMNPLTRELIKKYQRAQKRANPALAVDGRIDPAKGLFVPGKRVFYTIMSLNTDAMKRYLLSPKTAETYIGAMAAKFPEFARVFRMAGIGTLGLSLESGGVGSLGLDLE